MMRDKFRVDTTSRRAPPETLVTNVRSLQAEEWAGGFVTAYNYYVHPQGDVVGSPDLDGVYIAGLRPSMAAKSSE
jgi:hypothetical protein